MEVNLGFWGCTGQVYNLAWVGWECRSLSIVFLSLEGMTYKWSPEGYCQNSIKKEAWVYGKCVTFKKFQGVQCGQDIGCQARI